MQQQKKNFPTCFSPPSTPEACITSNLSRARLLSHFLLFTHADYIFYCYMAEESSDCCCCILFFVNLISSYVKGNYSQHIVIFPSLLPSTDASSSPHVHLIAYFKSVYSGIVFKCNIIIAKMRRQERMKIMFLKLKYHCTSVIIICIYFILLPQRNHAKNDIKIYFPSSLLVRVNYHGDMKLILTSEPWTSSLNVFIAEDYYSNYNHHNYDVLCQSELLKFLRILNFF